MSRVDMRGCTSTELTGRQAVLENCSMRAGASFDKEQLSGVARQSLSVKAARTVLCEAEH
jgi:hypothetical protein